MMFPFQFPVVYIYGEDPEDIDVDYQDACIELEESETGTYTAQLYALDDNFPFYVGKTTEKTIFLCVPCRASGYEFGSLDDTADNIETMLRHCNGLEYEEICAIAFGLKEISGIISK